MEDDNWDLQAVVRSCMNRNNISDSCNVSCKKKRDSCFEDLFEPIRSSESFAQEVPDDFLHNHKPFNSQNLPFSPLSVLVDLQDLSSSEQQKQKHQILLPIQSQQKNQSFTVSNVSKASSSRHNPTSRSKRRKNSFKRVCHISAENLSSDVWSWRKYGQKPIKGSPYPRGYYRCSTSKGCMARKQVERNRSDPGMFIVTYTSEHNHPMPTHRNSVPTGTSRQKPPSEEEAHDMDELNKPPVVEKFETSIEDLNGFEADDIDDEEDFSVSDMALDADFFDGLDDFMMQPENCFPVNPPLTCGG